MIYEELRFSLPNPFQSVLAQCFHCDNTTKQKVICRGGGTGLLSAPHNQRSLHGK